MLEQYCSPNHVDIMHNITPKLTHFIEFSGVQNTKINKISAVNINTSDDKNFPLS